MRQAFDRVGGADTRSRAKIRAAIFELRTDALTDVGLVGGALHARVEPERRLTSPHATSESA
jgi:hypothetical protein